MFKMRFRNLFNIWGGIIVVLLLMLTDPDNHLIRNLDFAAGTVANIVFLAKAMLGATLLYIIRKAMHDYDAADFEKLGERARQTPEGAAMYSIAIAIMTFAYALLIFKLL